MTESVTEVLVARARREEPLTKMVLGSLVVHVVVLGAVAFVSARAESAPPAKVFIVSLGGGAPELPRTGGLTPIGGRAIEKVAPPEPPKAVERPPAPAPPKMTLPEPAAKTKPKPEPSKATSRPAESAIPAPPTTGDQVRAGTTKIDTSVKGPGFGLSSSGGIGGPVLEVSDFCCPEYIQKVISLISANWDLNQQVSRPIVIRFTIQRDGTIEDATVKQSSGVPVLDFNARRAVQLSSLPRLPDKFTNPTLTVNLTFKQDSQ